MLFRAGIASLGALLIVGCTVAAERSELRSTVEASGRDAGPRPPETATPGVVVDELEAVRGVPARSRDQAVVAIDVDGQEICSGTLVSHRLVLTARSCVSRVLANVGCPASGVQVLADRDPSTLSIVLGDDFATGHRVARGVSVVAPAGVTLCDGDIAVLIVDTPIKQIKPLLVRPRGVALGDRVRAVGFGREDVGGALSASKLVREHVRVLGVSFAEFKLREAACEGDVGGPALDPDTGEIVGVIARGGTCDGANAHNVYTRADAFTWLVQEAFARVTGLGRDEDAGAPPPTTAPKGTKQKPVSDLGGPCDEAADCAAGVCVTTPDTRYCTRPCGPGDRCPARYHCKPVASGSSACINVR